MLYKIDHLYLIAEDYLCKSNCKCLADPELWSPPPFVHTTDDESKGVTNVAECDGATEEI